MVLRWAVFGCNIHHSYLQFLICSNLDRRQNFQAQFYATIILLHSIIVIFGGAVILKRRHSNSMKQDSNVTPSQRLLSFGTSHYPIAAAVVMAGLFFTSILAARCPTKNLSRKKLHSCPRTAVLVLGPVISRGVMRSLSRKKVVIGKRLIQLCYLTKYFLVLSCNVHCRLLQMREYIVSS